MRKKHGLQIILLLYSVKYTITLKLTNLYSKRSLLEHTHEDRDTDAQGTISWQPVSSILHTQQLTFARIE